MADEPDQGLSKEAWRGLAIMVIGVGIALMVVLWKPLLVGLGQPALGKADFVSCQDWAAIAEWGSFLVSVATLATVFYGFRRADETRREDIRAYVSAEIGQMTIGPNMLLNVPVKLVNYGKTVALKYSGVLTCTITANGFERPIELVSGFGSGEVHPTGPTDLSRHRDIFLNADILERFRSGRTEIVTLVVGEYTDTFGKAHNLVSIAAFGVRNPENADTLWFERIHR